nr:cytochrome c3 family protein [Desulfobulbaceae bacterium]
MFKNLMTLAVAAAITLCFAMVTANTVAADSHKGPGEMVLKTASGKKPSAFNHTTHQEANKCETCHHTSDATGKKGPYVAGEEKKCATCHNSDMANEKLNDFKKAAHVLCKECHKVAEKDGKAAPTKCTGCHIKGLE